MAWRLNHLMLHIFQVSFAEIRAFLKWQNFALNTAIGDELRLVNRFSFCGKKGLSFRIKQRKLGGQRNGERPLKYEDDVGTVAYGIYPGRKTG